MPNDAEPHADKEAARGLSAQDNPPLPATVWRKTTFALLISAIACAATLFGKDLVFAGGLIVGLVASIAAFIAAIITIGRNTRLSQHATDRLPLARCKLALLAAIPILVFNGWTCAGFDRRFHDNIYSQITLNQLRSIARAVDDYRRNYGIAPVRPEDLVAANLITDRWLVLPTDTFGAQYLFTPQCVPSFELLPTSRSTDILVHERGPWSVDGMRLFPGELHAVVYADGRAVQLAPSELAKTLQEQRNSRPQR